MKRYLVLWCSVFQLMACSSPKPGPNPGAGTPPPALATIPIAAAASSTSPLSSLAPVSTPTSTPLSIHVHPGDGCLVWPSTVTTGAGTDPTVTGSVAADGSGVARFYPPPASWGTQLTFRCGPSGGPTQDYSINLNDSSTFSVESDMFAGPAIIGTRAALSSAQLESLTQE